MAATYSWTVVIFLSLSSIISAQTCKWLHPNQGVVTRQILQNFQQMIPAEDSPGVCLNSNFSLPDLRHLYQITAVQSAAIAVREVGNQTTQFYRRYEERLDYHWPAWERLQELLYYQEQQLSDCIPEGAENQLFIQGISQQFTTLQRILEEQEDEVCARRTAHAEIRRNLLLAGQLLSRMRRQRLQRHLF
uniref:Type I interferon 1 n=1 Tax=Nanorana parkeri TaxID=125878 RepID=A0A3G1QSQ4_9NEOB|nr:type I interferon 1 [Nanorana parkeri]